MIVEKPRQEELVHHGKLTKVERYGWTVQDERGKMCTISKHSLLVDHTYQRNANEHKIKLIAREWSWVACGAIIVARRNGSLFVIDGQHRVLAAMKRQDIIDLPCIVFESHGQHQEAQGFLTTQTQRKPVTSAEKFKALITIRDKDALFLQDLIEGSERTMSGSSGPYGIKCVGMMLRLANRSPDILRKLWPLISEISKGKTLHERIVDGLVYIEINLPTGISLMNAEWRKRINKTGVDGLLDGAAKASALYSKGGAKVWATGMIEAINKGHRIRLEIK